jgi:hypothetical protein
MPGNLGQNLFLAARGPVFSASFDRGRDPASLDVMGSKLCPKLILEGTRLTFKTEIAFALNEHPEVVGPRRYRYHSPLISAEWCAFTNFPWGRGLINFAPEEEALALEALVQISLSVCFCRV